MANDKSIDLTRDRKVRMSRYALRFLLAGLVLCLGAGVFRPEVVVALIGIYTAFCGGVAGVLGFFSNANARVHEAQASTSPPPAAGFIHPVLAGAIVAVVVFIGVAFWAPWPWKLVALAVLIGAGCMAAAALYAADPEGRGATRRDILALVGAFLWLAAIVGVLILVPWWGRIAVVLVGGGAWAWVKRAELAARARAAWAWARGLLRRKAVVR